MTLNVKKFVAKINEGDLARSNLYLVRFPSMSNYLSNDGVIDNQFLDNSVSTLFGEKGVFTEYQNVGRIYGATKNTIVKGLDAKDSIESLNGLLAGDYTVEYDMGMMVKNVNLPGSTYEVDMDKQRRTPYPVVKSKTDDTVTMTMYLSENHEERRAMMAWYKSIYNSKTAQVAFFKSYAKNIEITTYNRNDKRTTVTTLINAFPMRVGEVTLGYENNNEVSTFEVEFVYEMFTYSDGTFLKDYTDQVDKLDAFGQVFGKTTTFFKSSDELGRLL